MRILFIVVTKKWFDQIEAGTKKEEYRDITPYWKSRLSKEYDAVLFQVGYSKNAQRCMVQFLGVEQREWFVIKLGEKISV